MLIARFVSKQERLREIPTATTTTTDGNYFAGNEETFAALPGSELEHLPHAQVDFCLFISRCLTVEK